MKWLSDNFGNIGNWCSILGLVITLYVLYNLRKIRKHYEYRARTPEIVSQLDDFSKDLNSYLDNISDNKNEIILTVKKLEYTLKSLRRKTNGEIIKNIDSLLGRTKRMKNDGPIIFPFFSKTSWSFDDEAWEIYSDIQGILQGVKEDSRDSSWREQ